jgi:hypothetical protein
MKASKRTFQTSKGTELGKKGMNAPRDVGLIQELPVLYWGAKSNIVKFKEVISIYLPCTFGDAGHFINNNRLRKLKKVVIPENVDELPKFAQELLKDQIRDYKKDKKDLVEKHIKMYYAIWGQLSEMSRSKVKCDPNWSEISQNSNPLLLWQAIERTHTSTSTGNVRNISTMLQRDL